MARNHLETSTHGRDAVGDAEQPGAALVGSTGTAVSHHDAS